MKKMKTSACVKTFGAFVRLLIFAILKFTTVKIAVFGTGGVGATIGSKLIELGHEVMMGSRTADNSKAMAWVGKSGPLASQGRYETAAAFGEIIFNCTRGDGTLAALQQAGKENLAGKVIIDVSNPLDSSQGMPPSLFVSNTNSLGEEIQKAFPESKVVKTLNTLTASLMVNPRQLNDTHNVFVSGNDAQAKQEVKAILGQFGWQEKEIIDLGEIATARGAESYLLLWLRIWMSTKNGMFNIKIVS